MSQADAPAPSGRRKSNTPQLFDFRRPNKLNRDQLRNLEIIHETYARQLSTVLSSTLRAVSHMSLASIEQMSYDEYVGSLSNPEYLCIVSLPPLAGHSILQLPLPVAMTVVDLLLGGHGKGAAPARPLTEIEVNLLHTLLDRGLEELAYAFNSLIEVTPEIVRDEMNPQFAQVAAPSDMMIVARFDLRIEEIQGSATLCYPYSSLAATLESFTGNLASLPEEGEVSAEESLQRVVVDMGIRLPAIRLTSKEITALAPGDVIPFRTRADEPILAVVAGEPLFLVRPARNGKRLACQILSVIDEHTPHHVLG